MKFFRFYVRILSRKILCSIVGKPLTDSFVKTILLEFLTGNSNKYTLIKTLHYIRRSREFACLDSIRITDTGVLQLYKNQNVFLFSLNSDSETSLLRNFNNYTFIRNSDFKYAVNYDLVKLEFKGVCYYRTELLLCFNDENKISRLRSSIQNGGVLLQKDIVNEFLESHKSQIIKNLDFLCQILNMNFEILDKIDFLERCHFAYVHGDFHVGNVMLNSYGEVVLIDLDRFSHNHPVFLDLLHFEIIEKSREFSVHWFDLVLNNQLEIDSLKYSKSQLIVYSIFRLKNELDKESLDYIYMRKAKAFLSLLGNI